MPTSDIASLAGTHDLRLPAWGPYTKRYIGISHIPDVHAGLRFDLSVFPGLYRRAVNIPNVMWESGYHPWEAAPDLSYFRHRHELIWKDQLYCDVDFCRVDETATLIRCTCVNNTTDMQSLALHYMASLNFPPIRIYSREPIQPYRVEIPNGGLWIDGLSYQSLTRGDFDARASLTVDGQIRGELRAHGFVDGQGLAQEFGCNEGDSVTYRLPSAIAHPAALLMRYRMAQGETVRLSISGQAHAEVELRGSGDFAVLRLDVDDSGYSRPQITLTSAGGAEVQIDGLAIVPAQSADSVHFVAAPWNPAPEIARGPRANTLILKYEHAQPYYGLAWGAGPSVVREFCCEDLDSFMRLKVQEHVAQTLIGPGDGHFSNVFMRPITLAPGAERTIYGLVCAGDEHTVGQRLAGFDPDAPQWPAVHAAARRRAVSFDTTERGETYRFSQERMAATLLCNVVYPVRARGDWIRHNTPGRWWDCLYTWDSGFIGLGLLELDEQRAIDCLNAYLTEPGERDAAFIHHGSPVPTQFYLFQELWNRTRSRELLAYFYPRLQQYHRFLAGRLGSSTTRTLSTNLLRTWDYFYNSGGWDDYPPQVYVHKQNLEATVTPVINTAQAIMTAKILRMAALALGEPEKEYDDDIAMFSQALHTHAWDEGSGYFGYVCHDSSGRPSGILRHESGANFDMGLDGAYPLVAGICTQAQEDRFVGYLMANERMWSRCGVSTVDQSAPYYKPDGYWNGAVWMPHQWLFWRALLDLGRADEAHRIAATALDLWKNEVESSYNCFEHFIVESGRGAGWHQFGGLSSPVLCWYGAYHRPGRLTTGLHAWVESLEFGAGNHSLAARLSFHDQERHTPLVIAVMAPGSVYAATWNRQSVSYLERYPGVLEITLPSGQGSGTLTVSAL
jgi:hypothetical protein